MSDQEAVTVEPLANVVHFFRTPLAEIPDSLTILGAGPIGILALVMAKLRGIARVCVVDKNEARLQAASTLRADHVVASGQEDPVDAVRRWSDGGTEVVIETAGGSATRAQAGGGTRRGGPLVVGGM